MSLRFHCDVPGCSVSEDSGDATEPYPPADWVCLTEDMHACHAHRRLGHLVMGIATLDVALRLFDRPREPHYAPAWFSYFCAAGGYFRRACE